MENHEKYMISCDWFQYFCSSNYSYPKIGCFYHGCSANPRGYVSQYFITGSRQKLPGYREHVSVMLHGYCLATLSWHPSNANVRIDGAAIKIDNKLLYSQEWNFYLHDILKAVGWSPLSITRIDLAYDCNFFKNHLHPQVLIQSYLNPQFAQLKESAEDVSVVTKSNVQKTVSLAGRSFIRKGSNRFAVEGIKALHTPIFEYLRFGSRKSAVCTYIYNKSQELRVKKSKPYISEAWGDIGLDTTEVYRVEISINSAGTWLEKRKSMVKEDDSHNKLLGIDDMAFERLDGRVLATQERLEEMFYTYAAEYFCFHIDTGQRRVKDMAFLPLFEMQKVPSLKPVSINKCMDSGRSERMISNHLLKVQEEFPFIDTVERDVLDKASKIFAQIAGLKRDKYRDMVYLRERVVPLIPPTVFDEMRRMLDVKHIRFKRPEDVVFRILCFMENTPYSV